mmetsp:Transcript_35643/g.87687  ORF Transcript_35643/g.87687 Transcript_35643/m.87687 type:complete len:235 (+) Transcript_35643:517-1221(+)
MAARPVKNDIVPLLPSDAAALAAAAFFPPPPPVKSALNVSLRNVTSVALMLLKSRENLRLQSICMPMTTMTTRALMAADVGENSPPTAISLTRRISTRYTHLKNLGKEMRLSSFTRFSMPTTLVMGKATRIRLSDVAFTSVLMLFTTSCAAMRTRLRTPMITLMTVLTILMMILQKMRMSFLPKEQHMLLNALFRDLAESTRASQSKGTSEFISSVFHEHAFGLLVDVEAHRAL